MKVFLPKDIESNYFLSELKNKHSVSFWLPISLMSIHHYQGNLVLSPLAAVKSFIFAFSFQKFMKWLWVSLSLSYLGFIQLLELAGLYLSSNFKISIMTFSNTFLASLSVFWDSDDIHVTSFVSASQSGRNTHAH
jgi:hypothetical protein